MVLLALFAFIAGAGTALSPCVLPVLPAVLSAGATGGRRRPLGVVLGLAATFTVTIAGLGAVAVAASVTPLSAATLVAWLTPTPPGVTETVLAIELPPITATIVWNVTAIP